MGNHSRTPKTSSCFEDSACRATPFHPRMEELMRRKLKERTACKAAGECPRNRPYMSETKCVNGKAGDYDCNNVDLLSFVPISELGSTYQASDSWGWTDPETGDEIAIIGLEDGTAFVQVTDPLNPIVLGFLPQSGLNTVIWSDMKVFMDHVFIIRESLPHGLQIMDLTKLGPAMAWPPAMSANLSRMPSTTVSPPPTMLSSMSRLALPTLSAPRRAAEVSMLLTSMTPSTPLMPGASRMTGMCTMPSASSMRARTLATRAARFALDTTRTRSPSSTCQTRPT